MIDHALRPLRYAYNDNFTGEIYDADGNHLMQISGKSAVDVHTGEANLEDVYQFWLKASKRSLCGICVFCCKSLGVEELQKPDNKWCDFVQIADRYSADGVLGKLKDPERQKAAPSGYGCTVYETRPQVCRDFECAYVTSGASLPEEFRPDISKVMIWEPTQGQHFQVHVDSNYPNAWNTGPIAKFIEILLKKKPLLIVCGEQFTLIRGDHVVEYPVIAVKSMMLKETQKLKFFDHDTPIVAAPLPVKDLMPEEEEEPPPLIPELEVRASLRSRLKLNI